jgi:methionyl-tRNA formyltransferase
MVLSAVSIEEPTGSIVELDDEIYVCTGSAPLKLGDVKPEGKSWMRAIAWWRGVQDKQNARFE